MYLILWYHFLTSLRKISMWYQAGQGLDIDESCLDFKERHRARCYDSNKLSSWHFKAYYFNNNFFVDHLCNFIMYQGKDHKRPAEYSATDWPVVKLVEHSKFHNKNHIFATDNWYTSFVLLVFLLKIGIHYLVIISPNRDGVPKNRKKSSKKLVLVKSNVGKLRSMSLILTTKAWFPVWFVSWMDNKPFRIVSMFQTFLSTVDRVVKSAKKTFAGYIAIIIPTVVKIYNKFMGGTDSFDQKLYYYKTRLRSKCWPIRIFTHFLEASVVNGHISYRDSKSLVKGEKGYILLSFFEMLIDQLAISQKKVVGRVHLSKTVRERVQNKSLSLVGRQKIFLAKRTREKVGEITDYRMSWKVCKK